MLTGDSGLLKMEPFEGHYRFVNHFRFENFEQEQCEPNDTMPTSFSNRYDFDALTLCPKLVAVEEWMQTQIFEISCSLRIFRNCIRTCPMCKINQNVSPAPYPGENLLLDSIQALGDDIVHLKKCHAIDVNEERLKICFETLEIHFETLLKNIFTG